MITKFESFCESTERLVHRWRRLLIALYILTSLVYFLRLNWYREMWSDEFYSLYISRLPLGEMWNAILTGADQHPPLFYLLTHYCLALFGENQFVLRIPATLGFVTMTLCIYRFTANRLPVVYALTAMLFPLLTGAAYYGQEGRGYGLVLGFSCLALLCWQRAADREQGRLTALIGMAVSLSVAVGSHYYAAFVLLPLAAGEAVRTVSRGRVDWPVWIAFSAPVLTLLTFLPAIQSARAYGSTFWAVPLLGHAGDYFQILFRRSAVPLVSAVLILTTYAHLAKGSGTKREPVRDGFRAYEIAALTIAVMLPLIVVISAKIGAGGFHPRYVLFPVAAFAIVSAAATAMLPLNRAVSGVVVLGVCVTWAASSAPSRILQQWPADASEYNFLRSAGDPRLPIVVSDTGILFRLAHYAPRDIAQRVVYLADPASALRFLKHDTVDKGLLALRPWFPVKVEPYRAYLDRNTDFLVYGPMDGYWNWLVCAFDADRIRPTMLGHRDGRLLMYVRSPVQAGTSDQYSSAIVPVPGGNRHSDNLALPLDGGGSVASDPIVRPKTIVKPQTAQAPPQTSPRPGPTAVHRNSKIHELLVDINDGNASPK